MTVARDRPARRTLVVFARAPERGRVKTRLAAELGVDAALAIYRELGEIAVHAGARAHALGAADEVVIAYTPADALPALLAWLGDAPHRYVPQPDGHLGDRMAAAIALAAAEGADRVVVVGTDCPAASGEVIAAAFTALDHADVVLGPALDGGYYLVGVRQPTPAVLRALFDDVPWSTPETLAVTLARAGAAGVAVQLLASLRDVDTADDWRAWQAERRATAGPGPVP